MLLVTQSLRKLDDFVIFHYADRAIGVMGSSGFITATGDGIQTLSGGATVLVTDVAAYITATGTTRPSFFYSTDPLKVAHAGFWALIETGAPVDSPSQHAASFLHWLEFEVEDWYLPDGGINADRIVWHVEPGVTIKIEAFW